MATPPSTLLPLASPPGQLSDRDRSSLRSSHCCCGWQQGATGIVRATAAAHHAEGQSGSQVCSIWQIIADKTQANQQFTPGYGSWDSALGLVGQHRRSGACWVAKCFDTHWILLNHQPARHGPPPKHTNMLVKDKQGHRSQIPLQNNSRTLLYTWRGLRLIYSSIRSACAAAAFEKKKNTSKGALFLLVYFAAINSISFITRFNFC